MFETELTSEDKLLQIIENPSALKKGDPVAASSRKFDLQKFVLSFKNITFSELLQKVHLRMVNRVIFFFCCALTLLSLFNFMGSSKKFENMYMAITTSLPQKTSAEKKSIADGMDFKQTLTMAKDHNIFTLDHGTVSSEGLLVGRSQEIANLKLVGIMWSDKPQAMIEDIIDQKTSLLGVGDKAGRLTVKEIFKDKVVLSREEHIWEFR